jgi:hypothetical protein
MKLRSSWAVLAGVLGIIVVTTLVDIVLHGTGVFPPMNEPINDSLALLATSYRVLIGVGGAWLTAWLAPRNPMRHAMILGITGVVLALVGVIVTWNMDLGPRWYPIALVVLSMPQSWLGGKVLELHIGGRERHS